MKKKRNAFVIGAGPAGCAAAIQLSRSGFRVVLYERDRVGGLLVNAGHIENYPGFPGGISGPALVSRLKRHLSELNISPDFSEVTDLSWTQKDLKVSGSGFEEIFSYGVVSTGTLPKTPDLSLPDDPRIMHEIALIRRARNKRIAVIGGGDAAFDYALSLGRHNQVEIISRSSGLRCLPLLSRRVEGNHNIRLHRETRVERVTVGRNVVCECLKKECACTKLESDYLVFAIGREPDDRLLKNIPRSLPNLKVAGDVKNGKFRQAAIAAGQGLKAAMEIIDHAGCSMHGQE